MNRRDFLIACVGMCFSLKHAIGWCESSADVVIGLPSVGSTIPVPADFIGLSYEAAQLANPDFFTARNRQLIKLFRELSLHGNLRIGGGSSEFVTYSAAEPATPPPFEVFGPDTSKTVKQGTITSDISLHNLRGFLDAAGWNCLYGLNLGQGSTTNAVEHAKAAQRILGERLIAFQIGNEPDSFRNRYRPASYGPADYIEEFNCFYDAISKAVPEARFAGPDISNKLAFLTAFAENARTHPQVVLLTSHFYAMGPARNPKVTIDNLLAPDPPLTTLKLRDLEVIQQARAIAHLPYRMSEGNSVWDGGKPAVSNTFASALWCAGYLLTCMQRGWAGADLHGGGEGFYTPIAGSPSRGFNRRPEFFGILFASHFVGGRYAELALTGAGPRLLAFAFERQGSYEIAIVNKTSEPVTVTLPRGVRLSQILELRGPAIDATNGTQLIHSKKKVSSPLQIIPYSATAYALHDRKAAAIGVDADAS